MADTVVAAANGNGVLKPVTKAAVEQSDVSLEVDTTPPGKGQAHRLSGKHIQTTIFYRTLCTLCCGPIVCMQRAPS